MQIEVTTNEIIDKMSVHKKGIEIEHTLSTEEQSKIKEWLREILGKGERIDTMHFPDLKYTYYVSGSLGYSFTVEERLTGNKLDLTDVDRF